MTGRRALYVNEHFTRRIVEIDAKRAAKEAEQIRARWEELKSVTEGFVACCEEGNFAPLKAKDPGLSPSR